jgi:hypothetical protein
MSTINPSLSRMPTVGASSMMIDASFTVSSLSDWYVLAREANRGRRGGLC